MYLSIYNAPTEPPDDRLHISPIKLRSPSSPNLSLSIVYSLIAYYIYGLSMSYMGLTPAIKDIFIGTPCTKKYLQESVTGVLVFYNDRKSALYNIVLNSASFIVFLLLRELFFRYIK